MLQSPGRLVFLYHDGVKSKLRLATRNVVMVVLAKPSALETPNKPSASELSDTQRLKRRPGSADLTTT